MDPGRRSSSRSRALVLSDHDGVRRQLGEHLARSGGLDVVSGACAVDLVLGSGAGAVVLDLSGVDRAILDAVLAAAARLGARIIALASIRDSEQELAVRAAGGVYRLKAIGDRDLADLVLAPGKNAATRRRRRAER